MNHREHDFDQGGPVLEAVLCESAVQPYQLGAAMRNTEYKSYLLDVFDELQNSLLWPTINPTVIPSRNSRVWLL
jgi:hypothetical protein